MSPSSVRALPDFGRPSTSSARVTRLRCSRRGDRIGGRVAGHELTSGEISETGGTFVGPTQDRVLASLGEFGIGTFKTFNQGSNVYVNGGQRSTFEDTGPTGSAPPDPLILPELATVVDRLDRMSTEVPVDAPWQAVDAAEYDRQTLDDFIRDNSATARFRRLIPAATRPIFGAEPTELSLLYVLFYIAASGNERNPGTFERNFNTRGGAQESRIAGGSQVLGKAMANRIGTKHIYRRTPVRKIVQRKGHVRIVSDRLIVKAKRVIVAIPPVLAGRIDYRPHPARLPRRPHPAPCAGNSHQGRCGVRRALLARPRPDRGGALHRRPRQRHLRRQPTRWAAGSDLRLRRRRQRTPLRAPRWWPPTRDCPR